MNVIRSVVLSYIYLANPNSVECIKPMIIVNNIFHFLVWFSYIYIYFFFFAVKLEIDCLQMPVNQMKNSRKRKGNLFDHIYVLWTMEFFVATKLMKNQDMVPCITSLEEKAIKIVCCRLVSYY